MDFITQNALGAIAGQAAGTRRLGRAAGLIGALGGAIPDFDFLLNPLADPAMPWEWHRHFTHSIFFIPVAALIAAIPFLILPGKLGRKLRAEKKWVLGIALLGAATHGALDMCTSFGTFWLWPLINERGAWDLLSIIDPLYSLPLFLFVLGSLAFKSTRLGRVGCLWVLLYTAFACVQHTRAYDAMSQIAHARGHIVERARVMPTFGNTILWRSVYIHDGRLYADAIHVAPIGAVRVRTGSTSLMLATEETIDAGQRDPERVIEAFRKFSAFTDGYVAAMPDLPGAYGDMRYGMDPAGWDTMWGIEVVEYSGGPDRTLDAVRWNSFGRRSDGNAGEVLKELFEEITNPDQRYRPIESDSDLWYRRDGTDVRDGGVQP